MRYHIDTLLAGYAAHREERIEKIQQTTERYQTEITSLYRQAEQYASTVQAKVQEFAEQVAQQAFIFRRDIHNMDDFLHQLRWDAPSGQLVESKEKQVEENNTLVQRLNQEAVRQDSDFEQFLRTVRDGGETQVSQNALKQAGLGHHVLSQYVLAYTRVKKGS